MDHTALSDNKVWDYVIIGTGMGGGPLGLRLAQAGKSVLFIEKGRSQSEADSIRGEFAELKFKKEDRQSILRRAGRFTSTLYDVTNAKLKKLHPFLGQGVGGSSALYGMVLERFRPADFQEWPVSYSQFQKYYDDAEALFKVRKGHQYLHPDTRRLERHFKSLHLNPYPLPLANDEQSSCGNCQSMLCRSGCKNDSSKICIEPAIRQYGAKLLTDWEVEKIESEKTRVKGVTIRKGDVRKFIQAETVVLAGGAIFSPLLLMKSKSESFPAGLGNNSDCVGRNLMRHFVDFYALKIDSHPENPHSKEIGLQDFCEIEGTRYGVVQSFGRFPPAEVVVTQMETDLQTSFAKFLFRFVKPVLKRIIQLKIRKYLVMASIVEDTARFENRIWSEDEKIFLRYQISNEDRQRIGFLRGKLKNLFKPLGLWFLELSDKNEMLAHVCGTCRMGLDPAKSVVGTDNRVHGLENLYVVDASFFPTSGGTNPALTVAANSLRVADFLIQK